MAIPLRLEDQRAAILVKDAHMHPETILWEETHVALGPFDETDSFRNTNDLFKAQHFDFGSRGQPVEVDVVELEGILVATMTSNQNVSGAHEPAACAPAHADSLREDGLARPKIPLEGQGVATAEMPAQPRSHTQRLLGTAADELQRVLGQYRHLVLTGDSATPIASLYTSPKEVKRAASRGYRMSQRNACRVPTRIPSARIR